MLKCKYNEGGGKSWACLSNVSAPMNMKKVAAVGIMMMRINNIYSN